MTAQNRSGGILGLFKLAYDRTIRPLLPRKIAVFNGVPVRQPRLFDATDVRPDYEQELVAAIRRLLEPGDDVLVIGGGWGVSTVVSARQVGPDGSVHTYEAGAEQVERVRETAALSGVAGTVTVTHAVVAEAIRVYGEYADADVVSPADLPDCDALVLDCEGAELEIIESMAIRPRRVVVEVHPMFGAPLEEVRTLLAERDYAVVHEGIEETPYGDVFVLSAERTSD